VLAFHTLGWWRSRKLSNVTLVDIQWALGFSLVALLGLLWGQGELERRLLVALLVWIWSGRLAAHLARRSRGRPEDPRYQKMRTRHGPAFVWKSLYLVFWLQALLLLVVAAPLLLAQGVAAGHAIGVWEGVGTLLWSLGFTIEAVADRQLQRFRNDPTRKGEVLDSGLWRYSRHPNYFGEALLWWGLGLIAVAVPGGYWGLVGPLLLTFLLLRVSGVTLLEAELISRKPGYREYVARTSSFLPWPPRGSG
jgi:steroid 5-alpha reductase family enzyme